jgi:hypothetical protein
MKVLQRQVAPVKRKAKYSNTYENRIPPSQVLYCIEEIQKLDDNITVQLFIRNLVTDELYVKHPLSLYFERDMLSLFSSNDISIVMTYVIFEMKKDLPNPVKFKGYDYSQDQELCATYDMRFKKILIKKHA